MDPVLKLCCLPFRQAILVELRSRLWFLGRSCCGVFFFFLEVAGVKMMFYDEVLLLGLYAELILRRKRRKKILDEVICRNSNDMACRSLPSDGANNTYPL